MRAIRKCKSAVQGFGKIARWRKVPRAVHPVVLVVVVRNAGFASGECREKQKQQLEIVPASPGVDRKGFVQRPCYGRLLSRP